MVSVHRRCFFYLDSWSRKAYVIFRRFKQVSRLYIKFTHETNKEDIAFLDLKVKSLDGKISTDLFLKSTGRHQFLHYASSHSEHTKRLIVFSQALRVSRICSYGSDFARHLGNMKSWFSKRGFPPDLVEGETKEVKFIPNVNSRTRGKSLGSHLS